MALIAMAVHSTVENDRLKYTKQSIKSLLETVDLSKHRVFVVNDASSEETHKFLTGVKGIHYYKFDENVGTARAINHVIEKRQPSEVVIKADDDVVWHLKGWVDKMCDAIKARPDIGILGLKRDDIQGTFVKDGLFDFGDDIMGTCTAFNPLLLDKIGYMKQFSTYGFDDVLMSARSIGAGFKNAYLPYIKIDHIDDGKNAYCEWKRQEAHKYLLECGELCTLIKKGEIGYYYGFN